jgi:hypothetical protein
MKRKHKQHSKTNKLLKATFYLVLVLMLGYYTAKADNYSANIQFQSAFSTGNNLPFWFTHNKLGKYPQNTKYLQLIDIEGKYTLKKTAESKVKLDIGAISCMPNYMPTDGNLKADCLPNPNTLTIYRRPTAISTAATTTVHIPAYDLVQMSLYLFCFGKIGSDLKPNTTKAYLTMSGWLKIHDYIINRFI